LLPTNCLAKAGHIPHVLALKSRFISAHYGYFEVSQQMDVTTSECVPANVDHEHNPM